MTQMTEKTSKSQPQSPQKRAEVVLSRYFTRPGVDPMSEVDWDLRSAVISGEDGRVVFEQRDVEVPRAWSQTADQRGRLEVLSWSSGQPRARDAASASLSPGWSIRSPAGAKRRAISPPTPTRETFKAELTALLVNQTASFNSPVYFNVGIEPKPQCSACFILKVDDNMESILNWYRNEGMIFKGGSGSGVNLSACARAARSFPPAAPRRVRSPS